MWGLFFSSDFHKLMFVFIGDAFAFLGFLRLLGPGRGSCSFLFGLERCHRLFRHEELLAGETLGKHHSIQKRTQTVFSGKGRKRVGDMKGIHEEQAGIRLRGLLRIQDRWAWLPGFEEPGTVRLRFQGSGRFEPLDGRPGCFRRKGRKLDSVLSDLRNGEEVQFLTRRVLADVEEAIHRFDARSMRTPRKSSETNTPNS